MSGLKPIPTFDLSPKISAQALTQRNIISLHDTFKLKRDPIKR